jgi:hypothetical protein
VKAYDATECRDSECRKNNWILQQFYVLSKRDAKGKEHTDEEHGKHDLLSI